MPRQPPPPALPPNFEAIWDKDSQQYYYVNKRTQVVSWDLPNTGSHHALSERRVKGAEGERAGKKEAILWKKTAKEILQVSYQLRPKTPRLSASNDH